MQFLVLESGIKLNAAVSGEIVPSKCGMEAGVLRALALDRLWFQDGFAPCLWMNP